MNNSNTPLWHDLEKYHAPEWAKWRAQNADGEVYDYVQCYCYEKSWGNRYDAPYVYVGRFEVINNWEESLISIEELKKRKQEPLSSLDELIDHDAPAKDSLTSKNKYQRPCKGVFIDVYDVLKAFNVTNPATAHAVKKLLASGQRGYKDTEQDLREAIESIERAIELEVKK